jgi:hypothetical protein
MPFKSKSQLRTCFGKSLIAKSKGEKTSWNCRKFLKETPVLAQNLPERFLHGKQSKKTSGRSVKHTISKIQVGPRGGLFFFVDKVKIYVPKSVKSSMKSKYKTEKKTLKKRKGTKKAR